MNNLYLTTIDARDPKRPNAILSLLVSSREDVPEDTVVQADNSGEFYHYLTRASRMEYAVNESVASVFARPNAASARKKEVKNECE